LISCLYFLKNGIVLTQFSKQKSKKLSQYNPIFRK